MPDDGGRFALVRRPATTLDQGIVDFGERVPVDVERATQQWRAYVDALEAHGWPCTEVPADDDLADSVFIEDTVVMFGSLAVVTNPAAPTRRLEVSSVAAKVRELGLATHTVTSGTFDGGDVLKVGSTAYIGHSSRTSLNAIAELHDVLVPRGWTVIAAPVTKVLHLKSAVTALPDGTVIGYGPVVDDPSLFDTYLDMPEEAGAHVVVLDRETVLMSTSAPRSIELLQRRGLNVVAVDIDEFEKLDGCVTCLSVRVREPGTSSASVPT